MRRGLPIHGDRFRSREAGRLDQTTKTIERRRGNRERCVGRLVQWQVTSASHDVAWYQDVWWFCFFLYSYLLFRWLDWWVRDLLLCLWFAFSLFYVLLLFYGHVHRCSSERIHVVRWRIPILAQSRWFIHIILTSFKQGIATIGS